MEEGGESRANCEGVLRGREEYIGCEFEGCCFICLMRGEIYRYKIELEKEIAGCYEVVYDYFDYNTIFLDEYSLVGLLVGAVRKVITLIKFVRK